MSFKNQISNIKKMNREKVLFSPFEFTNFIDCAVDKTQKKAHLTPHKGTEH